MVVPLLTAPHVEAGPVGAALRDVLADRAADDPIARFYRTRRYRPLWTQGTHLSPQAGVLVATLRNAGKDDLSPGAYHPDAVAAAAATAASGAPQAVARADIALSQAFAAYVGDLRRPSPGETMAFADSAVALAPTDPEAILRQAAQARAPAAALAEARRMNPIYVALRAALADLRRQPDPDPRALALLRINLDRARALPADPGPRYILVNPAAQTLWLYENGRVSDQMRVAVGKPTEPTPSMIGLVRYAVLDPYWNVPPDLARGIAAKVLAQGPQYLADHHLQALSDWSQDAAPVAPEAVDWNAVASGAELLRLRQLPGPDNMMGKLKFMLPNPLGVYLHDTPDKALFLGDRRADSAGCVRLADAEALGRRLFGRELSADPQAGPEQRVELAQPVPVYIVYLTAQPGPGGMVFPPDIYRRDPPLLAAAGYRIRSQASEPAPATAQ